MKDNDFINKGFKEFKPSVLDPPDIITCFQKRYDDETGKKYFITVKKWREWIHPHTRDVFPETYEYDVQLYKKDNHNPIDLLFHSSWNLEDVENYMEILWKTGLFDYYEEFE